MKQINTYITEKLKISINKDSKTPKTKEELVEMIKKK